MGMVVTLVVSDSGNGDRGSESWWRVVVMNGGNILRPSTYLSCNAGSNDGAQMMSWW